MGRVEELEHTADVGFRVTAETPAELFELAAAGLVRALGLEPSSEPGEERPGERAERGGPGDGPLRRVELARPDRERLLVAWLRELLGRAQAERSVPEATVVEADLDAPSPRLRAEVRWTPAASGPVREIKGVTYHGLEVVPAEDGWHASVVLDV